MMLIGDSFGMGVGALAGAALLVAVAVCLAIVRWFVAVSERVLVRRVTIPQCPVCGRRHEELVVSLLPEPELIDELLRVTHSGVCPNTGIKLFVRADGGDR